jgi:hypothetical protein
MASRIPREPIRGFETVVVDSWWGDASPEDPRIAYERFIDTSRIWVQQHTKLDGREYAYFGYDTSGDNTIPLKHFANFLRSAKYQKLMPVWWTPQHDIAMFRYACSDPDSSFYIYNTIEDGCAIGTWGHLTSLMLCALAKRIGMRIIKKHDELSDYIGAVILESFGSDDVSIPDEEKVPSREVGYLGGFDVSCKYGVLCKRRDCWFKHPRLVNPTGDLLRREVVGTKALLDHFIQEANGKDTLIKILDFHQIFFIRKMLIDQDHERMTLPQAEEYLLDCAKSGNSVAQYIVGKMYGDPNISFCGKRGAQETQLLKFWTMSAAAGNVYAQIGLGYVHKEQGNLPCAIHWFKKAVLTVAVPEAAFGLGLAYAGDCEDPKSQVPVQYEVAAKYYAHACEICLQRMKTFWRGEVMHKPGDTDYNLNFSVMTVGPSTKKQNQYLDWSEKEYDKVRGYIVYPDTAPVEDTKEPPQPVESEDKCSLCERRPNVGEAVLRSCKGCQRVKYCNSICQKGHWVISHKSECRCK